MYINICIVQAECGELILLFFAYNGCQCSCFNFWKRWRLRSRIFSFGNQQFLFPCVFTQELRSQRSSLRKVKMIKIYHNFVFYEVAMFSTCGTAHSLTHALTHLATNSITHSLTHSATNSFTYSLTHSATNSVTHSLSHQLNYSLTHSLSHQLTHLPTHSLTHQMSGHGWRNCIPTRMVQSDRCDHTHAHTRTHTHTRLLPHSLTHSLTHFLAGRTSGFDVWWYCL